MDGAVPVAPRSVVALVHMRGAVMKTASLHERVGVPGPLSLAYLGFAAIRRVRGRHLVVIDLLGLAFAVWLALDIPSGAVLGPADLVPYLPAAVIPLAVRLSVNVWFGLYSRLWVHASVPDLLQVLFAVGTGSIISFAVVGLLRLLTGLPSAGLLGPSFWFLEGTLALGVLGIARFTIRAVSDIATGRASDDAAVRVPALLFGAGREGAVMARSALTDRRS